MREKFKTFLKVLHDHNQTTKLSKSKTQIKTNIQTKKWGTIAEGKSFNRTKPRKDKYERNRTHEKDPKGTYRDAKYTEKYI